MKSKLRVQVIGIIFFLVWPILTLYPNPGKLFVSVNRLIDPPVDYHVEEIKPLIKETFDKTPQEIEDFVKEEIPYAYDWDTRGLPWYFPTVEEVLQEERGDCKSQLIIVASLFEFRRIPYEILVSPVHIWVSYEGKEETPMEKKDLAIASFDEEGFARKTPSVVDREQAQKTLRNAFWNPMPLGKKYSLFGGPFFFLFFIVTPKKFVPYSQVL